MVLRLAVVLRLAGDLRATVLRATFLRAIVLRLAGALRLVVTRERAVVFLAADRRAVDLAFGLRAVTGFFFATAILWPHV